MQLGASFRLGDGARLPVTVDQLSGDGKDVRDVFHSEHWHGFGDDVEPTSFGAAGAEIMSTGYNLTQLNLVFDTRNRRSKNESGRVLSYG